MEVKPHQREKQADSSSPKQQLMEFWHQLFLFALLLPFASCANSIYHLCDQNFTNNYDLQANIQEALLNVTAKTPSTGNDISRIGANGITIYGLTQCRGDVNPQDCSNCLTDALNELFANCPNSAALRIWYDLCKIRSDIINFLGIMDISDVIGGGLREDPYIPKEFDGTKWELLNWLKAGAASSNNRFAMGKRSIVGQNVTIYGMAQCTIDLSEKTCTECLEALADRMIAFCPLREGCLQIASSCFYRYENYDFSSPGGAGFSEQPENVVAYAPAPSALA